MATYYVSPTASGGSDANNGLGPDASAVTNKPWATIGKALGAAGIASGDTVYIGPGTYREVVTVAMTSAVAETSVLGDPGNSQGFKTAVGVLVSPAEVIWTAYTTNDTTAPSASDTLNLAGRDYLTFRYLTLIGGSGNVIDASTQTSTNWTIQDCVLLSSASAPIVLIGGAFSVSVSVVIERCVLANWITGSGASTGISISNVGGTGADYDLDITIRNVLIIAADNAIYMSNGVLANKPGGVDIYNSTLCGYRAVNVSSNGFSTTIPCTANNCVSYGELNATTLGQLTENYNLVNAPTTHTNVTQGANSVVTKYAPRFEFGQSYIVGSQPRPFFGPCLSSAFLTFGNDGTYTTAEDFLGLPRPGGGASATKGIGYLGRGNTFTKETGTVRTGSNAMSITGPGTQDFQLPVDATSTTATVYVRWDATYAGTKPLMKVLNGGECGVTDATATATGASGSWEQLSLSFTPARTGIVTIRLQSSDTNGAGVMFVDDFAVA